MNKLEFDQKVTQAAKPIVVDFWASWCGPCMRTKPILEKLAQEYTGRVEFMAVNADDSREVLEQFHVRGIPTVLTLRDGKEASRVVGAQSEANFRAMFEALAEGTEVVAPGATFNRSLRLGAGALLALAGIATNTWLVVGIGAIIAFTGIYDRCPAWQAITGMFQRK
jgi:thioredoxin 1